ncbi:hypothetical protein BCR44DRAFT_77466, partial [Catenaria anguillulae PL171]
MNPPNDPQGIPMQFQLNRTVLDRADAVVQASAAAAAAATARRAPNRRQTPTGTGATDHDVLSPAAGAITAPQTQAANGSDAADAFMSGLDGGNMSNPLLGGGRFAQTDDPLQRSRQARVFAQDDDSDDDDSDSDSDGSDGLSASGSDTDGSDDDDEGEVEEADGDEHETGHWDELRFTTKDRRVWPKWIGSGPRKPMGFTDGEWAAHMEQRAPENNLLSAEDRARLEKVTAESGVRLQTKANVKTHAEYGLTLLAFQQWAFVEYGIYADLKHETYPSSIVANYISMLLPFR